MRRTRFIFSLIAVVLPLWAWGSTTGDTIRRDTIVIRDTIVVHVPVTDSTAADHTRPQSRYRRRWARLIPTALVAQNAGNMGVVSAGIGWSYGHRRQWETDLLLGYIPKYQSHRGKLTITLKENFIPWSIHLGKGYQLKPLRTGLYVNTVVGHEFWKNQPNRYPEDYYEFMSTSLRFNVFIGQGIEKTLSASRRSAVKAISFFYEVSTCDLYIRMMAVDRAVHLDDILGLSLGLRLRLL